MDIEINMINVEDGDSIIIEVIKAKNDRVIILIDGGRESQRLYRRIIGRLNEVLKDKPAPDLIVCTHYDYDHIGGLIPIIEKYGNAIGEIWYQKPRNTLFEHLQEFQELKLFRNAKFNTFEVQDAVRKNFSSFERYHDLLEHIVHLNRFEEVIKNSRIDRKKIIDPKPGYSLNVLPQFKIIGPTREIIAKYIAKTHDLKNYILDEIAHVDYIPRELQLIHILEQYDAKKKLAHKSSISAANMLSIICLLTNNEDKYLFTGDAGIESLMELENQIDDLFFLDVPHHGRWNNLSYDLIQKMRAKFCFISGSNKLEDPNPDVVTCLSEFAVNGEVHITNDPTYTWYLSFNKKTGMRRKYINEMHV